MTVQIYCNGKQATAAQLKSGWYCVSCGALVKVVW